jgi:ATP-binding cassette subfamily B (MDR/TAP) protein 1
MELKGEQVVLAVVEDKDLKEEASVIVTIDEEKNLKEEAAVVPPSASSFSDLFSFADAEDVILVRLAFIMSALSGMNQPAQLIIFGSILNSFGVTSNTTSRDDQIKQVSFLAIMYAVVGAQQLLTNWSQTAFMTTAAGRQVKRIRERFLEALLRQPVGYFDQNDQGVLSASVMTDTSLVEEGLGEKLALAFQFSMAFIAGLAVALYYNYQLSLLIFGAIPILFILLGVVISILTVKSKAETDAGNAASSVATQTFGSIRTIFSLGLESNQRAQYEKLLNVAESAGASRWQVQGFLIGAVNFLLWLFYASGLYFGAYLISSNMKSDPTNCTYYWNGTTGSLHSPDANK